MTSLPDKKYQIIYADPPWNWRSWSSKGEAKSAKNHYNCMDLSDINKLSIPTITDKNCILFMWATYPNLKDGLEVIEAWGFKYKTVGFTWVKKNKKADSWFWGLGYYTRSNAEICLIATKGKPKVQSRSVHQVIDTPIEKHSKKPSCVREKIVSLMGNLPRIELFARQRVDGWDAWGNEI